MIMCNLTRAEIMSIDRNTPVVVPLGSTEQHGPHLPVNVDYQLVTRVALEAEKRTDILLAPTVWLGHSPNHMPLGATISADNKLYVEMMSQIVESFVGMGFQKILLLNGHLGNNPTIPIIIADMKKAHPDLFLCAANYYSFCSKAVKEHRVSKKGGMGHAGEFETSLYLYLFPDDVRKELIKNTCRTSRVPYFVTDMFEGSQVSRSQNFDEFTVDGVYGQPEGATAEAGKIYFEQAVDGLVEFLNGFKTWELNI